jgi:DNA invertase Pin-like site-specific DNA recombinase
MPIAISYIRFSSERQRLGDSVRRQLALSLAYCERNSLTLDESYRLADLGVSGFRGRNVKEGALAAFLEAVESGKIPWGSVLIVESLDRLSREQISDALQLFLRILGAGIDIVTLQPERRHSAASINDIAGIIEPIIIMSRANEESEMKSHRSSQAWSSRRKKAAQDKTPIGNHCPWWLEYRDGTYYVIPERAEMVRRVFDLRANGTGYPTIQKMLNAGPLKPRFSDHWTVGTLFNLITSRQVLGEFQPTSKVNGKIVKQGDPVQGYYPVILDQAAYYAAQGKGQRKGREPVDDINIFKGLLYSVQDETTVILVTHVTKRGDKTYVYRTLESTGKMNRIPDCDLHVIKYDLFERVILTYVSELDPADFVTKDDDTAREIADTTGRIAELDHKIAGLKRAIEVSEDVEELAGMVAEMSGRRKRLIKGLADLKAKQSNARVDAVGETRGLVKMMAEAKGQQELMGLKRKIRTRLSQLVERIWIDVEFVENDWRPGRKRLYNVSVLLAFHGIAQRCLCYNQDGNVKQNVRFRVVSAGKA